MNIVFCFECTVKINFILIRQRFDPHTDESLQIMLTSTVLSMQITYTNFVSESPPIFVCKCHGSPDLPHSSNWKYLRTYLFGIFLAISLHTQYVWRSQILSHLSFILDACLQTCNASCKSLEPSETAVRSNRQKLQSKSCTKVYHRQHVPLIEEDISAHHSLYPRWFIHIISLRLNH